MDFWIFPLFYILVTFPGKIVDDSELPWESFPRRNKNTVRGDLPFLVMLSLRWIDIRAPFHIGHLVNLYWQLCHPCPCLRCFWSTLHFYGIPGIDFYSLFDSQYQPFQLNLLSQFSTFQLFQNFTSKFDGFSRF